MKLPDFTNDIGLIALRQKMRATAPGSFSTKYKPESLTLAEIEQLGTKGIDVSAEQIRQLDDGTLGYKDSRVLVHIRDVSVYGGNVSTPRFHVAWCRTLQEMTENRRFGRYVVATRSDGRFQINKIAPGRKVSSSLERLHVCQNCLIALAFDEFSDSLSRVERRKLVEQFSIERFFELYPKSLHVRHPEYDDSTAPVNDYPDGFAETSRVYRAEKQWRCEECPFTASQSDEKRFLHLHHLNGQKYDNSPQNLQVLCIRCHANKPRHVHLKQTPEYKEFMRRYHGATK